MVRIESEEAMGNQEGIFEGNMVNNWTEEAIGTQDGILSIFPTFDENALL